MKFGQIYRNGRVWVARVEVAATHLQRMRGLLGRRELPVGHGLLIESCGSIHTLGMRFPIDVIFLDQAWQVRRICRMVQPGRLMVWGGWHGLRALEVAAGWLDFTGVDQGTPTKWQEIPAADRHLP